MNLASFIFYFFSAFTLVSGILILFTKNVLYAGFALLCTFLGVSAIYVFAGADFLAVTQIMIYVGGILVLILFGIMLTNRIAGQQYVISGSRNIIVAAVFGLTFFFLLVSAILKANVNALGWIQMAARNNTNAADTTLTTVGENLMTNFILPFEVAGLILMVALMGAAFIASQVVKR